MARTRPTRMEVRARLLDAALEVFGERGFEAASMDQVAAAAGFTKGALYSNFTSKDELFLALMERQVALRLELVEGWGAAPDVSLRELGDLLTRAALADRAWQLLFLDYWARALRDPDLTSGFRQHRRRLHATVTEVVGRQLRRHEEGVGPSGLTPEQVATLVLALSNGLAIEGLADPDVFPEGVLGLLLARLGGEG